MTVHEYDAPADVPAEHLFEHVAEPANLPESLAVDPEGWFRADAEARRVRWGAPGRDDYDGEIAIHRVGGDRSTVAVRLKSTREDGDEVRRELAEAVAALAQGAAVRTDAERADRQQGWPG